MSYIKKGQIFQISKLGLSESNEKGIFENYTAQSRPKYTEQSTTATAEATAISISTVGANSPIEQFCAKFFQLI
jgi:hypothetical protein